MSVSLSSAYSNFASLQAGKIYVPVSSDLLPYAHFDHVTGFAASEGQDGISISKLQILNALMESVSSSKMNNEEYATLSSEDVDSLIQGIHDELMEGVKMSNSSPYNLSQIQVPESGMLFALEV